MSRKIQVNLFQLAGFALSIFAVMLTLAFLVGYTPFFTQFGLDDPSESKNQAGRIFSVIIGVMLSFGLFRATQLFYHHVLSQVGALDTMRDAWRKEASDLKDGVGDKAEILLTLTAAVPGDTRVGAVLGSWQDASPDSSAEYVIEGKAASCRQQLGVLQTIASTLVLIGLVGNFFGLADAVKGLPELTRASASSAAPTVSAPQTDKKLGTATNTQGKTKYDEINNRQEAPQSESPKQKSDDALVVAIEGISEGLSVVVVSSIMGIGGMIVLLLYVTGFKSLFNSIVTEEVVLMSEEIGSLLRPSGGGGGGLSEEAQSAILSLPDKVDKFDGAATKITETFGRSANDLQAIAKSLDSLLKHEMVEAKTAYRTYQESISQFTSVLTDERKTLEALAERTNTLCDGMQDLAKSVQRMAQTTETTATRYQETQGKYENYLQLVTDQAEQRGRDYREQLSTDQDTLATALQTVTEQQKTHNQDLLRQSESSLVALAQTIGDKTKENFDTFRETLNTRMTERHEHELAALATLLERQVESMGKIESDWKETAESQGQANTETIKAAQTSLEETSGRLLDACDRITQTQDTVLKTVVQHWQKEVFDFCSKSTSSFDSQLSRLVDKFSSNGIGAPAEATPALPGALGPTLTALQASLEKLSHIDLERTDELKQVLQQLNAIKVPEELKLSQSSIEALQRPFLELATVPSSQGSDENTRAELVAALASGRPQGPIEISGASQAMLARSISEAMDQQLRPLLAALRDTRMAAPAHFPGAPPETAWCCNVCGGFNQAHALNCADCGTDRQRAQTATRIESSAPDLQEFVIGIEVVLQRELGKLLPPLDALVQRQEQAMTSPPSLQSLPNDFAEYARSMEESSTRSLPILESVSQVLQQTNDTLQQTVASVEKRDLQMIEVLGKIGESLERVQERPEEEEEEEAPSRGFLGIFRSRPKKADRE